jgi:hypothetical protein
VCIPIDSAAVGRNAVLIVKHRAGGDELRLLCAGPADGVLSEFRQQQGYSRLYTVGIDEETKDI